MSARRVFSGAVLPGCLLLVAALVVSGCGSGDAAAREVVRLSGATMGTTWSVLYVGRGSLGEVADVRAAVEATLAEVDAVFSTWREDSEISQVNAELSQPALDQDAASLRRSVSAAFAELTSFGLQLARVSEGSFDPTAGPLLKLYGFTGDGERRVPSDEELHAAASQVGHAALRVEHDADGAAWLVRDGVSGRQLELSSIAKGHGVDRVTATLDGLGFPEHFVEIGGEVRARGSKPDGSPWRVGIERPMLIAGTPREARSVVELSGGALATSGSYRNYVEAGQGRRVHHVLDARTGRNAAHSTVSVSVLAPTCAVADGWATLLLILGSERGRTLVEARRAAGDDLAALFLDARPEAGDPGAVREIAVGWPD